MPRSIRKGELAYRQLHKKDALPIEYKRFCQAENVEVPWDDIVKGYQYAQGQYVIMTDEDFERARVPAAQTITITDFVRAGAIDVKYFEQPYYLAPEGRGGVKAYALLRDALAETKRIGIGTIVLRQRERLVALVPAGDVLAMTTMRWAYEIRSPKNLDLPKAGSGWQQKEMDLAKQLIGTLDADWKPEKYRDTYREVLLRAIEQKREGKEISIPASEQPARVVNLVKALEQSLKAPRKELTRVNGRGAGTAKSRRPARHRAA